MKVPESHLTGLKGLAYVDLAITNLGWLFRPQPTSDYGIDAHVEIVTDGLATGRLLALQIRSGESYLRRRAGDSFVFSGDLDHLEYWISHSLPVVLVLYDPRIEAAYWEHVSPATVSKTRTGWTLRVPRNNQINEAARHRLEALAGGDPYVLALRRLQLERPWMQLLRDGNRLFLDVEEWINKTSGRGSFRLSVQNDEGEERIVQNWPFVMFPWAIYGELLPKLFPWADMSIDEEFYEPYDEAMWDLETRIWDYDPEDDTVYHLESYEEWAKSLPDGIRPYEEAGGEIARWRLELTLNAVGAAFLRVDDFLTSNRR